jgi:hypothetical protein
VVCNVEIDFTGLHVFFGGWINSALTCHTHGWMGLWWWLSSSVVLSESVVGKFKPLSAWMSLLWATMILYCLEWVCVGQL